jgi:iron-sulfur cluster repair protein YtfE (RIC family)
MRKNTPMLRAIFNDDDEIIARLDECLLIKNVCAQKNECGTYKVILQRIEELKKDLTNHTLS